MDFGLSAEQEILQRTAREFLEHECPPSYVRDVAGQPEGFSRRLHEKMAALGWTGLLIPERFGGLGLGMLDMVLLLEEMGRAAAPGPFLPAAVLVPLALRWAPAKTKQRWLGAIARGEAIGTVGLSEESDRFDRDGVNATARWAGSACVLDGTKMFVPYASVADFILAPFRTAGASATGVTLFLIPRETPGLEIRPLETIDITRRVCEVRFRRVRVFDTAIIGRRGEAWPLVQQLLDAGALGIAADCLGGAQKTLEMSVEYSKVRQQFGRPVGSFQALKHLAAEMVAEVEPCRSLLWYAAYLFDTAPRQAPRAVAMAKARLSDVYSWVANRAVQMHGGIGFTWEHDLHFWFKRAAANRVAFGDPIFQRERLAQVAAFLRPS